jgi:hypothetical protein
MGKITAAGVSIHLGQIARDEPLWRHLAALHPGDSVILEVSGFVGRWRRTANGIEPLDQNIRDAWTTMLAVPNQTVDVQLVTTDGSHLVTFGVRGQLWDDPASQYR